MKSPILNEFKSNSLAERSSEQTPKYLHSQENFNLGEPHEPFGLKLVSGSKSDRGKVRKNNEDSLFVDNKLGLFIIADGMGGQNAGEIASRIAIDNISQNLKEKLTMTDSCTRLRNLNERDIMGQIDTALVAAGKNIREAFSRDMNLQGMGTTVVLAVCYTDVYFTANLGDSRAYLWRADEKLRKLTEDHTMENKLMAEGYNKNELDSRYKHMLTRWVGSPTFEIDSTDIRKGNWYEGDIILLCSDGLTNILSDNEIDSIILEHIQQGSQKVCELLVEKSNNNGGCDNITVILIENKNSNLRNENESQEANKNE